MHMVALQTARALLTLMLCSGAVWADDASVNITGRVLSAACEPTVDPLAVDLGTLSRSVLSSKGATGSNTDFTLRLKSCPAEVSQVQVQFDGVVATGDNSALALTGSSVAKGVGVQLLDNAKKVLAPGTRSPLMSIIGGNSTVNSLTFSARYIAISDTVTAGSANASATFTIWYSK